METEEAYKKLLHYLNEANSKQTVEITKQINEVKEIVQKQIQKVNDTEKKFKELEIKYEKLEKSLRKNNIIIFGLRVPDSETLLEHTLQLFNERLGLDLHENDINDIYLIGKQKVEKPVIVKLVSYLKKVAILRNAKKLKGSKIFISEELNLEEREGRKILVQHLKQAKERATNAYIKGDKLYINGNSYTAQQLIDEEVIRDQEAEEINEEITEINGDQNTVQDKEGSNNTESTSNNKKTPTEQGEEENILEADKDPVNAEKKYKIVVRKTSTRSRQKK